MACMLTVCSRCIMAFEDRKHVFAYSYVTIRPYISILKLCLHACRGCRLREHTWSLW